MLSDYNPVQFNAPKHHLAYLQQLIKSTPSSITPPELRRLLLNIGAAQLDFYTGPLSVEALVVEVKQFLTQKNLLLQKSYSQWIEEGNGYRTISTSDDAHWVLRQGVRPNRWLHLHPARYSQHTIRVKAHTLKTAAALLIKKELYISKSSPQLPAVNQIRSYLDLPPLAARQLQQGLTKLIDLLKGNKNSDE